MGVKLKQGVEVEELNACALIDLFARHAREDLRHRLLRPLVPIADRVLNRLSFDVNQSVVNAPAINSNAFDGPVKVARPLPCFSYAGLYLFKDACHVPAKMAVDLDRRIMKPAHFFQQQFTWRQPADKYPSATGA